MEQNCTLEKTTTKVFLKNNNNYYSVHSACRINKGDIIFRMSGIITGKPSKFSIQTGKGKHITLPESENCKEDPGCFWKFLNHSCTANCYCNTEGLTVIAIDDIEPGTELTINYNATEYDMAEPFICKCESKNCCGEIKGFRYLGCKQKEELLPFAAKHIIILEKEYNCAEKLY